MPAQSPFPDEKNIKNYSYNSSRNTTGSALMSILSRSGTRHHFPDTYAVPAEKSKNPVKEHPTEEYPPAPA